MDQKEETLKNLVKEYDYILIDEAQDFPIELIRILKKISNNITCIYFTLIVYINKNIISRLEGFVMN